MKKLKSFFEVPIYLAGMPPSVEGDEKSGATIYLFTKSGDDQIKLELGKADKKGEFHGRISRKFIGKEMYLRVRYSPFKSESHLMILQPWGFYKAIDMKPDWFEETEDTFRKHPDIKEYLSNRKDGYTDADVKVQYAARNSISRTIWFWIILVLSITIGLIKFLDIPLSFAIALSVLLPIARTLTLTKSLGLDRKPILKR